MGVLSGVALLNRAYEVMLSAFDLTDILNADKFIVVKDAVSKIEEVYA